MNKNNVIFFLSMAAALGNVTQAAATEEWITDQNGCKLLNPSPGPDYTVTWSGGCTDGYASGTGELQSSRDGKLGVKYVGPMSQGRPHGEGRHVWPDGSRYDGDFVNGQMSGRGMLTFANGDRYEGGFFGGKFHGKGTMFWGDGSRYEGDFSDGQRTGMGTSVWADGTRFIGQWVEGSRQGPGLITYPDGTSYNGTWAGDKYRTGYETGSDGQIVARYEEGQRMETVAQTSSSTSESAADDGSSSTFLSLLGAAAQVAAASGGSNAQTYGAIAATAQALATGDQADIKHAASVMSGGTLPDNGGSSDTGALDTADTQRSWSGATGRIIPMPQFEAKDVLEYRPPSPGVSDHYYFHNKSGRTLYLTWCVVPEVPEYPCKDRNADYVMSPTSRIHVLSDSVAPNSKLMYVACYQNDSTMQRSAARPYLNFNLQKIGVGQGIVTGCFSLTYE